MRRKTRFITSPIGEKNEGSLDSFVSVILFSENHGYRMKSYGPISLMKIEGKALLRRQIETIKATFKNFEIVLCSGFETQRTVEFVKNNFPETNIRVVENQIHFNSNCCESARLCLHNINNSRILMCNGALLITPEMLRAIDYSRSTVLCQEKDEHKNFDVGVIENGGNLESLAIGVKTKVWNEIVYLSNRRAINSLYYTVSNPEFKNRFLFEAVNIVLKDNKMDVSDTSDYPTVKIQNIKTLKRITKI